MKLILIVLDDPARRGLYNRTLRNEPYRLVFAFDGEDGFDRFFETKPDLILVYEKIPRLDGALFVPLIRQQPGGSAVPIIILGQPPENPDDAEARRQAIGADAYGDARANLETLKPSIESLLLEGRPALEPYAPEPSAPRGSATEPMLTIEDPEEVNPFPEMQEPLTDVDGPRVPESEARRGPDTGDLLAPDPLDEIELVAFVDDEPAGFAAEPAPAGAAEAQLIAEVPRDGTPSNLSEDNRPSQVRKRAQGQRRSLDESQLGKRLTKRVRDIHRLLEQVDYYQLLGVERTAALAEIRKAHFRPVTRVSSGPFLPADFGGPQRKDLCDLSEARGGLSRLGP